MALEQKRLKDSLQSKTLDFSNEFFNLKGEYIVTTDMFPFHLYKALDNVSDCKTNNYSNLFLTNKGLTSDWLEVNKKPIADNLGIVTTLSFFSADYTDEDAPGEWLYFDKNYEFWDVYLKSAPYSFTTGRPSTGIYNYIFYINFLDDSTCEISHNFGDLVFFLTVTKDNTIDFIVEELAEDRTFNYKISGNQLMLFKVLEGKNYSLSIIQNDSGSYALALSDNLESNDSNVLYVETNEFDFDAYTNSSYIGYDRKNNISSINTRKSAFYLNSQSLLHHQYNKDDGINFVPLKNNANYKGTYSRGDNLTISSLDYPDVDYRTYTTIHSGINEEEGNDNIIMTYSFYDQVIEIKAGADVEFYIPTLEENNGREPLYPYGQLNISDTKFIKNGALASNVPFFADKFYRLQGNKTRIKNEEGETMLPNNGVYLCSWLYSSDDGNDPIWLDRYYYPDVISRSEALTSPHFSPSFENVFDKNYRNEINVEKAKQNTYFDKVSDVVLESGNTYKYSRISYPVIESINEKTDEFRIKRIKTNKNTDEDILSNIVFDNKTWARIPHESFNKTNKINMNVDIYLQKDKRMGLQLFGSDYKSGFNIQNRKDLSPFHYYATDKEIYLLNNSFEIKRELNLYEKYGETIIKFILGDVFDDVVLVTSLHIYLLSYDLTIKTKIAYENILNINKVVMEDGVLLLAYPYDKIIIDISNVNEITPRELPRDVIEYEPYYRGDLVSEIKVGSWIEDMFYETPISKIISNSNSVCYNNNIYVPYKSGIYKIIFTPDSKNDDFKYEERENYPAKIRQLADSEMFLNYQKTSFDTENTNEPTVENGFIEVQNEIKNVFIGKNGEVYGFNYDKIALSCDGDTMYGLYGWTDYINAGGWFWLYNQSLGKLQASYNTSKFAEFGSSQSIDFVKMNETGHMCLVRNFHNSPNVTGEKNLEIYDSSKRIIFNYDLSTFDEILCLDSYNYIDEEYNEQSVFTMLGNRNSVIYKIEYRVGENRVISTRTNLPAGHNKKFYETTNSNTIVRHSNENYLYFNLFLPNNYLYDYCETIKLDLTDIQEGWYNLNVFIDLDEAIFEVKINDKLYDERVNTPEFIPFVNSNGSLFDASYYIGNVGKKYGTTMNKILTRSSYDPYALKNCKMENLRIYTRELEYYEYQAMRLYGKKINPIMLTLPCGQRNNIEEIVRYFKYVHPASVSNKVRVNIAGTGLTTKGEFELLEKEIREAIVDNKDCLIDVKEIAFV